MSDQLTKTERERFQKLLMGAVDSELSEREQEEFTRFIEEYPQCRKEWQDYKNIKEVTQTMKFKSLPNEVWDTYWLSVYNRIERGIAWIIFSIGAIILLTYGGFKVIEEIIADPHLEGIVKIGILGVIGGSVILFVSVIREKLFTRKTDPYKEVQR